MKIGSLIFATRNRGKIKEAESILGVKVKGTSLEIEEIQSFDPVKVTINKARAYYKTLRAPLFAEDTSLAFDGLNGLPGTYINDMAKALGNGGLVKLLRGRSRKAVAQVTIVYIDGKGKEFTFIGISRGTIAKTPKGERGFGWDPIFIPLGERKTFAEMSLSEKNNYSMRREALVAFKKWLSSH